MDGSVAEAWLESKVMCFVLRGLDLQHEGPHRRSSAKGESSSMEEDTPTSVKHGCRSRFRGTVLGEVIVRGIC
jgi:hypothetical protein